MRKNKKNNSWLLAVPALMLLLSACSESDDIFGSNSNREIKFRVVEESDWNATRAVEPLPNYEPIPVKGIDGEQLYVHTFVENGVKSKASMAETTRGGKIMTTSDLQSFHVIGYKYAQDEDWSTTTPFFYNRKVVKQSDNSYTFAKGLYWPSSNERFNFYAFAPEPYSVAVPGPWGSSSNVSAFGLVTSETTQGKPQVRFKNATQYASDATDHDIVVAKAENITAGGGVNGVVDLTFKHILARLRFVIGANNPSGYKITGISIDNVVTNSVYTFNEGWTDFDPNTLDGSETTAITGNIYCDDFEETSTSGAAGTEIKPYGETESYYDNNGNEVEYAPQLFVIPQTFPDSPDFQQRICLTIERESDGNSGNIYIPLQGQKWEEGKTITYAISTSALNYLEIGEGNQSNYQYEFFDASFYDGDASYSSYLSEYNEEVNYFHSGDKAGLFIVNSEGVVSSSNLPVTYNGTRWVLDNRKEFNANDARYYFYYPYQATLAGAHAVGDNVGVDGDEETFFADAIDNWVIINDGTIEGLKSNIKIGSSSRTSLSLLMDFDFNCPDEFIYAVVEVAPKPIVLEENAYLYTLEGYGSWTANRTETIMPSTVFPSNMRPIIKTIGVRDFYFYLVRKNTDTEISATGVQNGWTGTINVNSNNKYVKIEPSYSTTPTQGSSTPTPYELRVGDVYFSDGSIGHTALACAATPVGIVVYVDDGTTTADDLYTEKDTKAQGIGGHGLVMCLKKMTDSQYTFGGTTGHYVTNDEEMQTYISGYTESKLLAESSPSDNNSIVRTLNYSELTAPNDKSTGWFMPSAAQLQKAIDEVSTPTNLDYSPYARPTLGNSYAYFDEYILDRINNIMRNAGISEYDNLRERGNYNSTPYWRTSSEYSSSRYIALHFHHNYCDFVQKEKSAKNDHIRPFLAF